MRVARFDKFDGCIRSSNHCRRNDLLAVCTQFFLRSGVCVFFFANFRQHKHVKKKNTCGDFNLWSLCQHAWQPNALATCPQVQLCSLVFVIFIIPRVLTTNLLGNAPEVSCREAYPTYWATLTQHYLLQESNQTEWRWNCMACSITARSLFLLLAGRGQHDFSPTTRIRFDKCVHAVKSYSKRTAIYLARSENSSHLH